MLLSWSNVVTSALLFSQFAACTNYLSPPLPYASEDLLISDIQRREVLYWEIVNPILEGMEVASKILHKYIPPGGKMATYYEGILEDFIEDNKVLFDILRYAKFSYMVYNSLEFNSFCERIARAKNWGKALEVATQFRRRMWESASLAESGLRPGPNSFASKLEQQMNKWREMVPFYYVKGEIQRIVRTMPTNDGWIKWLQRMHKLANVQPHDHGDPEMRFNPNGRPFFQHVYAKALLNQFAADLRRGVKHDAVDYYYEDLKEDRVGASMLMKDQSGYYEPDDPPQDHLLAKLKIFKRNPQPKNLPLKALLKAYHPSQNLKNKQYMISDLLGAAHELPSHWNSRFGNAGSRATKDDFEQRSKGLKQGQKGQDPEWWEFEAAEPEGVELDDSDDGLSLSEKRSRFWDGPEKPARGFALKHSGGEIGQRTNYDLIHGDWHPLAEESENNYDVDSDSDASDRSRLLADHSFEDFLQGREAGAAEEADSSKGSSENILVVSDLSGEGSWKTVKEEDEHKEPASSDDTSNPKADVEDKRDAVDSDGEAGDVLTGERPVAGNDSGQEDEEDGLGRLRGAVYRDNE